MFLKMMIRKNVLYIFIYFSRVKHNIFHTNSIGNMFYQVEFIGEGSLTILT